MVKAVDLDIPAARAFQDIAQDSPLRKLSKPDRTLLYSMLLVYARASKPTKKRVLDQDPLEGVAKLLDAAAKLGAKLDSELFHGAYSDVFHPYTSNFSDLPGRMVEFSKELGGKLELLGKPGHKEGNLNGLFLIVASEFVRLKAGQHLDEYLAELYQAIAKPSFSEDLSGDAIRKRRKYLKNCYPDLYSWMLERAKMAAEGTAVLTTDKQKALSHGMAFALAWNSQDEEPS